MPLVAGYQIVGTRGFGAFEKLVVAWVPRHQKRARGYDGMRMAPDELEKLLAESFADFQLGARKNFPVLRNNRLGNVEPGRFGDCKQ